ncbi:MAG: hypothetical protein BWX75_00406 [Candidatus Cloacimonetes bacterium ADurb.Bin088]|jgi:hypothetical protein|nr:MAG: hypothetical protein BWX75_00406 [Candidatus Cloacimonetes bacterium ADurb.Bin088]
MPHYLLSLANEELIANYLLLKTIPDVDHYLFVQPKGWDPAPVDRVCSLCGIAAPLRLEVEEFCLADIERVLESWLSEREQDASYTVNLTGGSRLMALAVADIFRRANSRVLYLPPRVNHIQQLHPRRVDSYLKVTYRCSLDEYLAVFGVSTEPPRSNPHSIKQMEAMFRVFTANSTSRFMRQVNRLGARKIERDPEQIRLVRFFARELGISPGEVLLPEWLSFIKGAWFEEYLAWAVDRELGEGTARHGLQVEQQGVSNELDCAFTHANRLYVMELKASAPLASISEFLYKLDSVARDFSLNPRCFLGIVDPDVERGLGKATHFRSRARKMGIRILCNKELSPGRISKTLRQILDSD